MRLCTWNVNGLESLLRKGYFENFVHETNPDIICLQETKISRRKLAQWSLSTKDWNCFLSFCKTSEGYSGVGTFCKLGYQLLKAEEGVSGFLPAECFSWNPNRPWFCHLKDNPTWRESSYSVGHHFEVGEEVEKLLELDKEGRCIIVEFPYFVLFNVYVPFDSNEETFEYKYLFVQSLLKRIDVMLKGGKNVVVCGDFNCARKRMDHCDPEGIFQNKPRDSPFELDPCRKLLNEICTAEGPMVDVFRYFHPDRLDAYTCWNTKTGARKTNFGTRIDYILANKDFVESYITDCDILNHIHGSDHCPVYIDFCSALSVSVHVPEQLPPFCCQHFPDLVGSQQSLKDMVRKSVNTKCDKVMEAQTHSTGTKTFSQTRFTIKSNIVTLGAAQSYSHKEECASNLLEAQTNCDNSNETAEEHCLPRVIDTESYAVVKYQKAKEDWRKLFRTNQRLPLCTGHNEPCLLRIVRKKGSNHGRKFYVCGRPIGKDEKGRCNFFLWHNDRDTHY